MKKHIEVKKKLPKKFTQRDVPGTHDVQLNPEEQWMIEQGIMSFEGFVKWLYS